MLDASPEASQKEQGGALSLLGALEAMSDELRARLMHFCELSSLGELAATCARSRSSTWSDAQFWRAFAGPQALEACAQGSTAADLRDKFRRWLFRLDSEWFGKFRELNDRATSEAFGLDAQMVFSEAHRLVQRLMPSDRPPASDTIPILREALSNFSADQEDERELAEGLMEVVERRLDLFRAQDVAELGAILERATQEALLDRQLRLVDEGEALGVPEGLSEAASSSSSSPSSRASSPSRSSGGLRNDFPERGGVEVGGGGAVEGAGWPEAFGQNMADDFDDDFQRRLEADLDERLDQLNMQEVDNQFT